MGHRADKPEDSGLTATHFEPARPGNQAFRSAGRGARHGGKHSNGVCSAEALYAMRTCWLPMMPAIDDRLTVDPPPLATIAGIAYLMPKNTPGALTAVIRRPASVL